MKRSEMIDFITQLIGDKVLNIPNDSYLQEPHRGDNGAELILSELEKKGMAPPYSHDIFNKRWKQFRDPVMVGGNEWDEE